MTLKKYDSYVKKAFRYEVFGFRKKAIEIMEKAVEQPFSKLEIGSGYIYLGLLYRNLKELNRANAYFEQALELCMDEEYPYSPNYKIVLQSFLENGEIEKEEQWRSHLINRDTYDKKIKNLKHKKQLS